MMPDSDSDKHINGENIIIKTPLEDFVREIAYEAAEKAASKVITEFNKNRPLTCPMRKEISNTKIKLYILVALLIGSGTINLISALLI